MQYEKEHHFQCPYCWEQISMVLELQDEIQEYIEDCEVCCQPIKVIFSGGEGGEVHQFSAVSIEQ